MFCLNLIPPFSRHMMELVFPYLTQTSVKGKHSDRIWYSGLWWEALILGMENRNDIDATEIDINILFEMKNEVRYF